MDLCTLELLAACNVGIGRVHPIPKKVEVLRRIHGRVAVFHLLFWSSLEIDATFNRKSSQSICFLELSLNLNPKENGAWIKQWNSLFGLWGTVSCLNMHLWCFISNRSFFSSNERPMGFALRGPHPMDWIQILRSQRLAAIYWKVGSLPSIRKFWISGSSHFGLKFSGIKFQNSRL